MVSTRTRLSYPPLEHDRLQVGVVLATKDDDVAVDWFARLSAAPDCLVDPGEQLEKLQSGENAAAKEH